MSKRITEKSRESAFNHLIELLAYSERNKDVAELLNRSPRTIRRWKHEGKIPDKAILEVRDTLNREFKNLQRRIKTFTKKNNQKPVPRPIERYYKTQFDGRRILYVITAGIPCDDMIHILLSKANQTSHISGLPIWQGFYMRIRQSAPTVFRWDGEKRVNRGGYVIDGQTYNTIYFDINQDSETLKDIIRKYCKDGDQEIIKIGFSATHVN